MMRKRPAADQAYRAKVARDMTMSAGEPAGLAASWVRRGREWRGSQMRESLRACELANSICWDQSPEKAKSVRMSD